MSDNQPTPIPAEEPVSDVLHDFHARMALQGVADDYQVPMSQDAVHDWVTAHSGAKHQDVLKTFTDYIKPMAMGMYPTLSAQIQQGIPVRSLMEPYRLIAKNLLGEDAQIDWSQPHWNKALTGNVDPATNRAAPMSMDQWRQQLMIDPVYGYGETDAAQMATESFLDELNQAFHRPGGFQ